MRKRVLIALASSLGVALLRPSTATAERPDQRSGSEPYTTVVHGQKQRVREDGETGFYAHVGWKEATAGQALGDLLTTVPGLRIRETGSAGRQLVTVRGADSHQVAVYVDGVRLTTPGRNSVDLSLFDPAHLAGATLQRSGLKSHLGGDALAGALLLKTNVLSQRRSVKLGASYGAWNTIAANASYGDAWGHWRTLISGSYGQSDGDFLFYDHNGEPGIRANNDYRKGQLLLKADYVGANSHHQLLNIWSINHAGAPGPTQLPSQTARQQLLQNVSALKFQWFDLFTDHTALQLMLFHRYGYFSFEEPVGPPPVLSRNHHFGPGAQLRGRWRWLKRVTFELGVEAREEIFRDPDTSNPTRFEIDGWLRQQSLLFDSRLTIEAAARVIAAEGFGAVFVPKLGVQWQPLLRRASHALQPLAFAVNIARNYRYPVFKSSLFASTALAAILLYRRKMR